MTDNNVTAFPGVSVPGNEPVAEVIALLEEALEKARSGKLQGVAVIMIERNPELFELAYFQKSGRYAMAAGALALQWKLGKKLAED